MMASAMFPEPKTQSFIEDSTLLWNPRLLMVDRLWVVALDHCSISMRGRDNLFIVDDIGRKAAVRRRFFAIFRY
jgi:hypothetical protein